MILDITELDSTAQMTSEKGIHKANPIIVEQSIFRRSFFKKKIKIKFIFNFIFISKLISLKVQRSATLLPMRYTRETPYLGKKE